ncbi:MAG: Protein-L-isoaspartate O-methyltransferase [Methanobacterium sp. PtaU1.Bin242]|nr:MAG: Protein-L-isoaspartate O-methyltransferase [Methanobacterium sp. PtaU1.Bin242]
MDINELLSSNFEKYFDFLNRKMVEEQLIKRGIKEQRLLDAFLKIKRHKFIPESLLSRAYDDYAIEILPGQTISQPYINAFMIEKLELNGKEKVLEIGTGTGYQTALLCSLAKEVYSIDIKDNMLESSNKALLNLGLSNFKLKIDDGKYGWPEFAPYNRIIISCAIKEIPGPIFNQLSMNGIMIAPIGDDEWQTITKYIKTDSAIKEEKSIAARFVKMI